MTKHRSPISGIAAAKNFVATAGYDNQIILWDKLNKQVIAKGKHDHLVNQCEFSPCGNFLVTSSSDYSAKVWSVPALELVSTLRDHADDVEMSVFHPGEQLIATASRDNIVRVFDFEGNVIHRLHGHSADVISVTWGKEENQLISSSDDGTIKIWAINTGEFVEIDLDQVETDSIITFQDGTIYAGNDDGDVVTIKNGKVVTKTNYFKAGVKRLIKSEETQQILALSYDKTLKIFTRNQKSELNKICQSTFPDIVWPRSGAFAGEEVLFGSFGDSYAAYNPTRDEWITEGINHTGGINAVTVFEEQTYTIGDAGILKENFVAIQELNSPCNFLCGVGELLVAGGQAGTIYNAITGEVLFKSSAPLNCMTSWIADKNHFCAVGNYTGKVIIFIVKDKKLHITKRINALENAIKGISNNGQTLFYVGAAGDAGRTNIGDQTNENLGVLHDKIANGCDHVSKDTFVTISRDLKLRLICTNTSEVFDTPHDHSIKSVVSDTDGKYVATGTYNGFVGVFNIIEKRWDKIIRVTKSGVSSLAYDKSQNAFLAGSYDGQLYPVFL